MSQLFAKNHTSQKGNKTFNPIFGTISRFLREQPIWLMIIALLVFFSLSSSYFLSVTNLFNILVQSTIIGFMAIGMTFLMINGNIDISVGAVMALCASLVIGLQSHGLVVAIGVSILAGIMLGMLNGLIITKTNINSFIVTLAAMIGVRGLVFVYTKEKSIVGENLSFTSISDSYVGPIPILVIVFFMAIIFFQWILSKTTHGKNAYAVGGNYDAAVNAGIKVKRHVLINFIIMGFLTAIAGIVLASRMNASTPNIGEGDELWVITAVVLGGTRLVGGFGSIWRTLGGVLIIGILRNGLNLLHVQAYYILVIMGLILIMVLLIDKRMARSS